MIKDLQIRSQSPQLLPINDNIEKRLIDEGMLHLEASIAGNAERYTRGETSHTIHVWWARRPHSTMRALTYSSLCKDVSDTSKETLKDLSFSSDKNLLETAEKQFKSQYGEPPKVLDMFGGGGTIPLEASNLGAKSYSIDSNQLSVFIQKANLLFSQSINTDEKYSLIKESGTRVLTQLTNESNKLFPLRNQDGDKSVFGYFWTYSYQCPNCNFDFFLSKRRWLSKKKKKNLALVIENEENKQTIKIDTVDSNKFDTVWLGRSNNICCPNCKEVYSDISIKQCKDSLVALVKPAEKSGKVFIEATDNDAIPSKEFIIDLEKDLLRYLNIELPDTKLPVWSGIVNPALYGIETHSDFINPRQRVMLLLLIKSLIDEYKRLSLSHDIYTAKYVIANLTSLIDQLVDWNCRLSMWISQNEQVGRAFCGPGVSMYWDYIETDPVLNGPANLWSKLDRILKGITSINKFSHEPEILHAYAQNLPFPKDFFDAIVTDPPRKSAIPINKLINKAC